MNDELLTAIRDELRTELSVLRFRLASTITQDELRTEVSAIRDELRTELSAIRDGVIHIGAAKSLGWLPLAFTVNYVLLVLILWRVW